MPFENTHRCAAPRRDCWLTDVSYRRTVFAVELNFMFEEVDQLEDKIQGFSELS